MHTARLKKILFWLLIAGALFVCGNATNKAIDNKGGKPNIIFLFADDHSYSAVNALGNSEVYTPNLDHLKSSGITFSHSYNMGAWNGAVCIASRAMMNTGRTVWHAQEFQNHQEELYERGELWGQLMQKAGYETYMAGKWHVNTDAEKVFNHVVNVRPGMPHDAWNKKEVMKKLAKIVKPHSTEVPEGYNEVMPFGYNRPLSPADTAWKPWDKSLGGYWEGGKHWSKIVGDDAIAFLDEAKNDDKPFFMYLAFNAPHDPRQSPKEFIDRYPLDSISLPEAYLPEYPYRGKETGLYFGQRDESVAPYPRSEYAVKVHLQEYYATITHMDQQIGRILEALEKSGKADNTYIIYTADHGLAVGKHGLMGKQNMYDHSVRVPLFIVGPGVPKNKTIDADVYLQDIMATALDIAGLEKPEYIEFNSFMPLVNGERKDSFYPAVYGAYREHQRMVRADGFKLIVYPKLKRIRLFYLTSDPKEIDDLATNADYDSVKIKLFKRLIVLQKEMDDPLDLTEVFPRIKFSE
ncbi:sulfatase-like hydrolase/transferase [Draconibacterium orientale]|uniref:sulfatase-like hydrolase/transferase n=1 Tax=Draconibacterium orientale TaxID=1168034 RepID=UPI002ABDBEF0|nr:sulfatase-like hydrolase/transferase [Draconibacterium orientale]